MIVRPTRQVFQAEPQPRCSSIAVMIDQKVAMIRDKIPVYAMASA
jgi:hypothetical protein